MKKYLRADIEHAKNDFKKWQERNPSKSFKDYFAETVGPKLQQNKGHASLGGNLKRKKFGESRRNFVEKLVTLGLKPHDACVDYGCGTLRLGLYLIAYLRPGAYWGMDVAEFLLEEGRRLIGEELLTEKQPHLRVISPQSVAEAATCKPAMLISFKVLNHVHPDELQDYVVNILEIIGTSGQAIIRGKWSGTETIQYSGRSWAHGMPLIEGLVRAKGGKIEVLHDKEAELRGLGLTASVGMFRITRRLEDHSIWSQDEKPKSGSESRSARPDQFKP